MRIRRHVNLLVNTTQEYDAEFFHGTNSEGGGPLFPQIEAENPGY